MFFQGFGGEGHLPPGRGAPVSDTTKLYAALEVEKGATEAEVRKAYRRLAMKHHPDKGGDPEKFKEICEAYETLSNPQARKAYDAGLGGRQQGAGNENPQDIFASFFGGRQERRSSEDVIRTLRVTLEEAFVGCTRRVAVKRQVLDSGEGAKACGECGGRGARVEVIRMGAMIQQIQTPCGACGGLGKSWGTREERKTLEVFIPRGAPDGHRLTYRGLTDERPDVEPGDLVFVVRVAEHPIFERHGSDLHVRRRVSLIEALAGFELEIVHLDGRKLAASCGPGERLRLGGAFDPEHPPKNWEAHEDFDCPTLPEAARAEASDVEALKRACDQDLRSRGVDSDAFVFDGQRAFFKRCTRAEALAAKVVSEGRTLYVRGKPSETPLKAVVGEGMPCCDNPLKRGNLFVHLSLALPETTEEHVLTQLRALLPPPLNPAPSEDAEVCRLAEIDPYASYAETKPKASDQEPSRRPQGGGPQTQCHQQ